MVDARPTGNQLDFQADIGEESQFDGVIPGRFFIVQHPGHADLDAIDTGAVHRLPSRICSGQKFIGEVALGREVFLDAGQYAFELSLAACVGLFFCHRGCLSLHLRFFGGGGLRHTGAQREGQDGHKQQ